MAVSMVTCTEAWHVAFGTSEPLWEIIKKKKKINIFCKTNLKAERNAHSTW